VDRGNRKIKVTGMTDDEGLLVSLEPSSDGCRLGSDVNVEGV